MGYIVYYGGYEVFTWKLPQTILLYILYQWEYCQLIFQKYIFKKSSPWNIAFPPWDKLAMSNGTKIGPLRGSESGADGSAKGSPGTGRRWNPQAWALRPQVVTCDPKELHYTRCRDIRLGLNPLVVACSGPYASVVLLMYFYSCQPYSPNSCTFPIIDNL